MKTPSPMATEKILQFHLKPAKALPIIDDVITQALSNYETLKWTHGEYATCDDGEAVEPRFDNEESLSRICSVCLLGAIQLAIYARPKKYKTRSLQDRAEQLTVCYLRDRLTAHPTMIADDETRPTLHRWNDELHDRYQMSNNDAKLTVTNFLRESLATLKKEIE